MSTRPRTLSYRARRIHRWLGLFIGIQFMLWTLGGLYFSWTRLDAVHGDHLVKAPPQLAGDVALASPTAVVDALRARERVDSLTGIELARLLGRPVWRVRWLAVEGDRAVERHALADGATGALRPALGREEAVAVARGAWAGTGEPAEVRLLTADSVDGHHEYRAQPLPAWAVHFGGDEGATVYVAAELGQVTRVRNDRWRLFDFLWMLHTMDFRGRDDINNVVLRAFSVLGLVTVLSGFLLFALTSRPVLARRHRLHGPAGLADEGGAAGLRAGGPEPLARRG